MQHSSLARCLLIPVLVLPAVVSAEEMASRAPHVVLSGPSSAISLKGGLAFQVQLLNAGSDADAELVLYRHMEYGVVLLARMTDGTALHPAVKGWTHYHELCPPPPPARTDFVSLEAAQFLGQAFRRTPAQLGITAPGTYLVYAQYWLSVRREGDEWRLSLRERPVESAPISLTVRSSGRSK